jgi:UDP-hydrolysing UDP-N-acetyl-D-glucosamine 2-epimerase
MTRILSISSSRADVSVLLPVWQALAARPAVELHVLATGMHMKDGAPTLPLPDGVTFFKGGEDIAGGAGLAAAHAMAACVAAVADVLDRNDYDCVLLIGDRLDMIPAALATLPYNIPLAHIHGGELTYGAIDERTRHALTKLSHLHCVSTSDAAKRLVRMGEEAWRVHVTGAPGLDTLDKAPTISRAEFVRRLKLPFDGEFLLVTVHPETNSDDPAASARCVLDALDRCGRSALITAPNSDPGGLQLRTMIDSFAATRPWIAFRESLGPDLYPNALRLADAMVGNSSSGLIEAGFFGLPVVNVGSRQDGRVSGPNVRHVGNDSDAVANGLSSILAERKRLPRYSAYGDGQAGQRIAEVLSRLPERRKILSKIFYQGSIIPDFTAPWESASYQSQVKARAS